MTAGYTEICKVQCLPQGTHSLQFLKSLWTLPSYTDNNNDNSEHGVHSSDNYHMQAQCPRYIYLISNIYYSPLGCVLLFSSMRKTWGWRSEGDEVTCQRLCSHNSRAEIPVQVQSLRKTSPSRLPPLCLTTVNRTQGFPESWHFHRTALNLHNHLQKGCRTFIIRPIFQVREPRAHRIICKT